MCDMIGKIKLKPTPKEVIDSNRIKHLEQQITEKDKRIDELEKAICIYFREFIWDGSYIIDMDEDADSKAIDNFIKLTSKYW